MVGLLSVILPPLRTEPRAAEVYRDLQARLARYATVSLTTVPTTGNGWDHEGRFTYVRPDKGSRSEPNFCFVTDGRQSWGLDSGNGPRPAEKGDLAKGMGLPGFETFFDPTATVEGDAPPRLVERFHHRLLALDLTLDGTKGILYLDAATRLPFGWAVKTKDDDAYLPRIYTDIRLGGPPPKDLSSLYPQWMGVKAESATHSNAP